MYGEGTRVQEFFSPDAHGIGTFKRQCTVENCLQSDDTRFTIKALKQLGVQVEENGQQLSIKGKNGRFDASREPVFLGNSGTSMRLLTALAALGKGRYILTGTERMQERPLDDLLDGLGQIDVAVHSVKDNGCPPVEVTGGIVQGGSMRLRCGTSSQYLSAILLIAPCTRQGIEIEVIEGPVSKPYIDMTIHVMEQFGIHVERSGYHYFKVAGGQTYQPGRYVVEPDCSQAGYFWAAAAVTGSRIKVLGTTLDSLQGDIRLLQLFEAMGCRVQQEDRRDPADRGPAKGHRRGHVGYAGHGAHPGRGVCLCPWDHADQKRGPPQGQRE